MAATRDLPNEVHFKEFQNDPVTGHHYTATCGETALAQAMVCASPPIESTQDAINLMTSMTREMMSKGWADTPNGSTTVAHLKEEAELRGFVVNTAAFKDPGGTSMSLYQSFSSNLNQNWLHAVLLDRAGVQPIVLEVSKAYNLHSYNGGSDEAGVQYHYICVVGINPDGYVCMDGDNSTIATHLEVYPWSVIQAAGVCGVLILEMQEVATVAAALDVSKVSGYFTAKSDTEWDCKNGFKVQDGILAFYRSLPGPAMTYGGLPFPGLPVADRTYIGDVCIQVFERAALVYDPQREHDSPPGASGACYFCHLDDPKVVSVVAAAQAQADAAALAAANVQVEDLKGQLAAAEEQKPTEPVDPPTPASDALGAAVRALFAEVKKEGLL